MASTLHIGLKWGQIGIKLSKSTELYYRNGDQNILWYLAQALRHVDIDITNFLPGKLMVYMSCLAIFNTHDWLPSISHATFKRQKFKIIQTRIMWINEVLIFGINKLQAMQNICINIRIFLPGKLVACMSCLVVKE